MKKIKVYLQYPWGISDSQYYKSMTENPPQGVEYINVQKKQGMIINQKKLLLVNFLKRIVRGSLEKTQLPIPNAHKTHCQKKYDLIHCAHCLSLNKTPWVFDVESWWQMWISGRDTKKGREKVLKILENDNCKNIITWTNGVKKEICLKFPEIKNKIEVVGYGQQIQKVKKIPHEGINLLFISRYFNAKGGLEALEVLDYLTKKHEDVKAIFVSQIPKRIIKKYKDNKKLKLFTHLVPHEKLINEIYPLADIWVYPGYSDTFGFMFAEAMSFGIPTVTVDGHSRKDVVEDGKQGFIVKRPEIKMMRNFIYIPEREKHIKEIIEKVDLLIKNKKLREEMSLNCIKAVEKGKFSIEGRNKKLRKIYEEVLK